MASPPSRSRAAASRPATNRPGNPDFKPVGRSAAPGDGGEELEFSRLFVSSAVVVAILVGGMMGLTYLFGPALTELGTKMVEQLGGFGVMLGYLVPDALTVPIPADVVASIGMMGGMSFAAVCFWGSMGSLVGGSLGWAIGSFAAFRWPSLQARIDADAKVVPFLKRNSTSVLAAAALTPLPYSIACWGVGALRMPYGTFILVSLLRIPRVCLYLFLVQQGVLAVGGL